MHKKSSTPLVSVIIPTHNRAEMLKRALKSVLAQTWEDYEVIVVSDGSTDDTDKVMASFKDPRIHFLQHEKSQGASAARNTGISHSRGDYVAFLDDDDEWTANKLEVQMPVIINSDDEVGLVYAWMEYYDIDKMIKKYTPEIRGDAFVEMLDKQAIGGCPTIIIKRKVIDIVKGFDEELPRGNDGDFIRRISKHFMVDYVPEVLARIQINHADRISINSKNNLKNAIKAFEKRLQVFHADFCKFPVQKSNVLAQITVTYLKVGQLKNGCCYLKKMLCCHSGSVHKIMLMYKIAREIVGFFFRYLLLFRRK